MSLPWTSAPSRLPSGAKLLDRHVQWDRRKELIVYALSTFFSSTDTQKREIVR